MKATFKAKLNIAASTNKFIGIISNHVPSEIGIALVENKLHFLEVSVAIAERVDPIFFLNPMTAVMKALGM